jgi:hypothetical protein
MVSISNFTRKFANGQEYAVNFPYTDDFDFPYVSFGINLDAPPDRPSIQKALVKCLPGVRSGGRFAQTRTRPPPIAASRWPVNVEANCDQGVLARRVAGRSGGRSRHDERWRRSSNYRASRSRRLVGRFCQALAPNAQHRGSLRRPGDARLETKKPRARGARIWSDRHRLSNQPRYRSAPPCRIARTHADMPDIVWADDETGRYAVWGKDAKGNRIVVERSGPIRIVGARR